MNLLIVAIAGFASGIVLRSLFIFGLPAIGFIALLGLLFIGSWFFTSQRIFAVLGICLIALSLGAARFHIADTPPQAVFLADLGESVSYEGTVSAEPDIRDSTQRITVIVEKGDQRTKVLAITERYPAVSYGDTVRVTGTLALPEPFSTDALRVFRYDKYLEKDGIRFLVEFSKIEVLASREGFSLYVFLLDLKYAFNNALSRALPEPSSSLASGLLLGGKQGLGEDLQNSFVTAGLIHVVVLSGFNVIIVAVGVMRLLFFLPRRIASLVAGVVIGLFVLMAGAGAASIRAGAMAGLGLFARATGRTYAALRALLFVGFVMIMWNPFVLVYDPGFQLSFIATAGLILVGPLVATRLFFVKSEFLREIAATTIAAQAAVLPLLLYQTGLFSAVALPANLLVLPFIPLAMGLSFLAGLLTLLLPGLAILAGLPAYAVLSYIIATAESASAFPLASFSIPAFPFYLVVLVYAGLIYFTFSKRSSMTPQLTLSKKAST